MLKKKMTLLLLLAILSLILVNNCGYHLSGHGNQIPGHIKTIVIPDFDNKTTRIQAEQFVTFAVKEEFIKRSKLRIVNRVAEADSILEGTIETFSVKPVDFGEEGSANLYQLTIVLSVRFIDLKNNKLIFEGKNISFRGSYDLEEEDFFYHETEKLEEIAEEFAESVVISILENF
jgi:outer membrane lipopolysaccharide assembly protein LptE/RlpB